jgi:hypothetical protein
VVALLKRFSLGDTQQLWQATIRSHSRLIRFVRQAALLPLLLPLLAFAGAKAYLHYSAVSVVEQAVASLPDSVQFGFDDIDSHFDGVVELYGVTLLLDGMSLPVRFDRIQLISDSWRELPLAAQILGLGQLPHRAKFTFQLAETELIRLARARLLPIDNIRQLLGCYRPLRSVSDQGVVAQFSGSLDYRFDPASEYLNGQLTLAAAERFQLELKMDLDIGSPQLEPRSIGAAQVGLGSAELRFFNLGSQTQLLNECGAIGRSGLVQGSYVARQSKVVKHGLLQQGWIASTELELAYQDYLFQPVQLNLQLSSPYAISLADLQRSSAGWGRFKVVLGLNPSGSDTYPLQWRANANQLAAAPVAAPVATGTTDAPLSPSKIRAVAVSSDVKPASAPLDDAQLQHQLNRTVTYQPSYKPVTRRQLAGLLGAPLKLTTRNGRTLEGVLDALERDQLQLRREISHGFAVVPVRLDLIRGMQAYF